MTFTAFAQWPDGSVEELDVQAKTQTEATLKAKAELAKGYDKGWRVTRVVARATSFFYDF